MLQPTGLRLRIRAVTWARFDGQQIASWRGHWADVALASYGLARWYLLGYHRAVDAAVTLRRVRLRSGLTLRALAARAETSHSTLSAYESGRKVPTVETLDRIVRAAGYELGIELTPAVGGADRSARGRELAEVLELAEQFPARHGAELDFPVFPRAS